MTTGIIRNNNEKEKVIEYIRSCNLPIKFMFETMLPTRSIDQNEYLWGVVYKRISDHTGHTLIEVHDGYKKKFLLEYCPDDTNQWGLRIKSTTELTTISIMDYALMIRADAEIEYGITIELPNEVFNSELSYNTKE